MLQIKEWLLAYGEHAGVIVIILNSIIIGCLIYYIIKNYNKLNKYILIASSMILGGGISNLLDRVFRGYVVDYIDINYLIKYPIFNLADIFIVIGVLLIIGNLLFKEIRKQENS